MIAIFSPAHALHAPAFEIFRGQRVRCFETPARADLVQRRLAERGHTLTAPHIDSRAVLVQVHTPRYLRFLEHAWQDWLALNAAPAGTHGAPPEPVVPLDPQEPLEPLEPPYPSVWPVRTLRSDREPANFTAKLGLYSMDNGCTLTAGSWPAAKAGSDAAASAAALVLGGAPAVFCCTRPPGHHAGADFMGGYCFINNAAVAAQALIEGGLAKVAILDVDYHHGNGTQSIFYDRADVLYVSIHGDPLTEYPFYLGHADEQGTGRGQGFNLNLPLPAGSSSSAWFAALHTACDRIALHGADALVVSLGLDAFEDDPISTFSLLSSDFSRLGEHLGGLGLPIVWVLEGGYAAAELGIHAVNVLEGFERTWARGLAHALKVG